MAAPVTQEEISIGEQSAVSIPDCTILSSNLKANLKSSAYTKSLQIIIECLKSSVLMRALTIHREIPKSLVNLAFSKATFVKENDVVSFAVLGERILTISKKNFILLMGLPNTGNFITPTAEELIGMFNQMGCTPMLTKISQFKKNKLPFQWSILFTIFKWCLCGRRSGLDSASQLFLSMIYGIYYNVNIDYGSILWYEFSESVRISTSKTELTSHRFWSVIVESAYSVAKIPFDTTEEPKMTFNEFQVPKKIPSQPEFEFVGQIPVSMIGRIPLHSEILIAFKSETSQNFPLRVISEAILHEIQTQNVKVSLKRKDVAESSAIEVAKPKKKKSRLRKLVLIDESEENEAEQSNVQLEDMEENVSKETVIENMDDDAAAEAGIEGMEAIVNPVGDETMLVRTEVVNEEEMGGDEARIENEIVCDEVEQAVVVTTVEKETVIVESEGMNMNVSDMVVHQTVVTEAVTIEVRAPVVNEEIDDTEENRIENLHVENDSEQDGEENTNEEIYQSCSVPPPILNPISEPILNTTSDTSISNPISEPISNTISETIPNISSVPISTTVFDTSIYDNLRNLNVTLPVISPVIPPVTEEATILENISDGEFLGLSDNEEFELAPIPENVDDMNDDTNDDQFISMKQFKILNQKLNMIIRFQDLPKEKELEKETEIESIVLNFHEKLEAQSQVIHKMVDECGDFKKKVTADIENLKVVYEESHSEVKVECADIKDKIQILKDLSVQSDENGKSLREELLHLQGMYENEVKKKLDEAVDREEKLQKIVDESIAHIKVLEESIKTYDEKEIAEEYNEKVVKHVEMVQQDFIARLSPLINFVKRIPKPKEGTSEVSVTVTKPFRKMDLHLFKSTVDTSLPYFNSSTTAEPQTVLQALTYPMITQQQPEAALRALDVARRLSKGVVIGSSSPQMTTSTIVSTVGEGSSLPGKGKEKQVVIELSKEEKKMKGVEAIEKLKQQMSLIRQGDSAENLGLIGESKIWTETTIREVAFGDGEFFNMLPRVSYEVELTNTQQLDLPILPQLFKVKCFMVKAHLQLLSDAYEEKLIRFYGCLGKPENEVWSSKPIVKVLSFTNAGIFDGVFENKSFKVLRMDNKVYDFTLADFPTMNPSDLIRLFKLFNVVEKVDVHTMILHLKKLLKTYVEKIAEKDCLVSKELFVSLRKPDIRQSGISKEEDGKIIHNPEWGVVSSARVKGKFVKSFMRMDEKGLFETTVLESILRRIHQNDDNSVKEKRDVEDQLRWWIKVRKEILDLITVLYVKG